MDSARHNCTSAAHQRHLDGVMTRVPKQLHPLANCRLLAIDWGITYTGVAARVCRYSGPQPCGLIQRMQLPSTQQAEGKAAYEWALRREPSFSGPKMTSRHATQGEAIATLLNELRIAACVVGMPYHADGSYSQACRVVEEQAREWRVSWPPSVPTLFWDESFSTRRVVGARRPSPGSRASRTSHAMAACVILEEVCAALLPLERAADLDGLLQPLRSQAGPPS